MVKPNLFYYNRSVLRPCGVVLDWKQTHLYQLLQNIQKLPKHNGISILQIKHIFVLVFSFTCAISRKLKPRHRTIYRNTYNKCTLLKQKRENIRIKQYKFRCCTLACPRLRRINKIHQLISIRLHPDGATIP